jgi:two-component system sensor histidine kinase BaeS
MLRKIRRHLTWKLFLSYLVVIVVGVAVLASTTELVVPPAFQRHMAAMATMMGGMGNSLEATYFVNFRQAVNESLALAALASSLAAVAASLLVSRRIVVPVRAMLAASRRIAGGDYAERVSVPATAGDLDELGQLALSFNQMAATLESTEARRRDLIANVAHELRTPLASIQGYMEGLIDGVVPADATTYEKVHHEAGRLQKLVQDLQELSQVESGAFTLDLRPVSVTSLVATAVARLGLQFEEKAVDLATDVPADLPPVRADGDRTGQVLLNIVGNALHYTPGGGMVRVLARHEGTEVHLAVEDTGIGLRAEHLPHLFERFYRVDRSRSRVGGGSGIGLTIAKHLVEAQGGRIWAESPGPGKGSTFHFTLPVA